MTQGPEIGRTTDRLLDVKRGLGHDSSGRREADGSAGAAIDEPSPSPQIQRLSKGHQAGTAAETITCVYCGYSQQGSHVNRCPECGLLFALQMRDPTSWKTRPAEPFVWARTALDVWAWNRRIRVRTAIMPASAESRAFAFWSIALAAPLVGLAIAFFKWRHGASVAYAVGYVAVETVLGAALAALSMMIVQRGLRIALQGRWRSLTFVPSSVDYATAWWVILAITGVCCGLAFMAAGPACTIPVLLVLAGAVATWMGWLWSSIAESQNLRFVPLRVTLLVLCLALIGNWVFVAVSNTGRMLARQLTARAAPARPPITYAVLLNLSRDTSLDGLILAQLKRMGVRPEHLVRLNPTCSISDLENALAIARSNLWPRDRFVFYLNCRGASDKTVTAAKLAGELLTADALARLLSATPTDQQLIAIESEQGDAFLPALKRSTSGVVVTCPDVPEFRFSSGLQDFWETWGEPESDKNKDGKITLDEAFDAAYKPMRDSLDKERQRRELRGWPVSTAAPELTVLGKADRTAFSVAAPKADNPESGSSATDQP